ncbi:MAG TPA: response regulator [Pyrinomonadaceae bacterium]|jgi:CheY-like chemotaxis protein/tetratricopeptide (TPR) repeat protein|nr:response regulator [Pyrinomonadaceae bacterium]
MSLEAQLTALKTRDRNLPLTERTTVACRLARQLEKVGKYELAYEALAEFWPDRDASPRLEGLDEAHQAEVLMRIGAIAGWLGSTNQMPGGQEIAKDIITKSIEIFERLERKDKAAEARGDLGLCYWREGSYDEARIQLDAALKSAPFESSDLTAILLIRAGVVEVWAQRLNEGLRFYDQAVPYVEKSDDHALKGSFHFEYGLVLRRLSAPENREELLDRALIEYTASGFHYEQAGNNIALARVELNLGYLFFTIGKHEEAHQHLDIARHLFLKLGDKGTAAQVDDTRARTLLAQGHAVDAERIARHAARVLERGGQQALLAEVLTTQGVALARSGHQVSAKALLERAIEIAETAGDLEGAGRAKLTIIEEFGDKISAKELIAIYRSAIDLLKSSQHPETGQRLIKCADALFRTLEHLEAKDQKSEEHTWQGFSFKEHVKESERTVIERALRDAGGSVTKAAHLLGFNHHQSLISLLNTRHKDLLKQRTTVRKRRRHLFYRSKKGKKQVVEKSAKSRTSQIAILHVEDNRAVARTVQDTLVAEGMHADFCLSGAKAMEILKSDAAYDLILVDNDLPGLSGLEITLRVQSIPHRRNTPVIMLSGEDCEAEAWRAGVKAFLRKPEGIHELSSTIKRVLAQRKEQKR